MSTAQLTRPARLFFSYSHKDEELRDQLASHLSALTNVGLISEWHDRRIDPGEEWAGEIDEHLQAADIVLLLISSDFLSSKYCYQVEMRLALEQHEAHEACVIPVILRPVAWRHMRIARLQALPKNALPITSWENRDEALVDVTEGIARAVENLRNGVSWSPDLEETTNVDHANDVVRPVREKQGASARKGVEAMISLIRDDAAARDEAVKFRSEFRRLRQQLIKVGDHKDLHDLLHELQVHSYKAIVDEVDRFPDDKSREVMSEYEFRLGRLVDCLDETTARSSFTSEQVTWMQKLHEARQALYEAVDGPDVEKLQLAIRLLKSVLARQPSKIATRLNAMAGELRLEILISAMTAIQDRMSPLGSDAGRISDFAAGAQNLIELNERLARLMEDHFRWQEVDDHLRRVEDFLSADLQELTDSWPDIQREIQPLYGPAGVEENNQFRTEGEKLELAIQENNPSRIRYSFRRFRAHATIRFYETDKKLRELCGSLADVAEPLDQVLHILGDRK